MLYSACVHLSKLFRKCVLLHFFNYTNVDTANSGENAASRSYSSQKNIQAIYVFNIPPNK
jgi:hypothetical protein